MSRSDRQFLTLQQRLDALEVQVCELRSMLRALASGGTVDVGIDGELVLDATSAPVANAGLLDVTTTEAG